MSAPSVDRLRTELSSFFAALWPSLAPSQARFGHIHLPPYRPSGGKLSHEIHRSVSSVQDSARLFLIVPETEMKIAANNGELFELCQRAPVVMTYASFLAALPSFRTEDRTAWNPQSREDGEIVVVFHIDPTFPADCSLALIALVHWAMDVSSDRGIMRVITMSSDRNCNELERLVAIRDPNMAVDQLDVSALGAQDPVGDAFVSKAGDHYAIASEILDVAVANPERPQTIISFEGKSFLEALLKRMEQTHQGPIEVTSVEDDTSMALLMEFVGSSHQLPNLRLLEMDPCLPVLPMALMSDSIIHVVLGSKYSPNLAWNATSEDAAPVETSREQLRRSGLADGEQGQREKPEAVAGCHMGQQGAGRD
ncbi:hypothetical protein NM208_g7054 [Fusarium decemcellulare]|uniref:Uncharacterized protein n=1 Tax=Fusarium decemcellulare TaxID=57161 RepID=A0ACC1SAR7_9HYPO|nr:hypothetical protein NM208_g7054 [Fusarium decemcellulare]